MDDSTLKALIAATGVITGAIFAALSSAYASSRKIREIEISYHYKLQDNYLENARKLSAEIYIPISISLTSLLNSYMRFSAWIDFEKNTSPTSFRADFESECLLYLETVGGLMKRGADAYMTTQFDERLQKFTTFLRDSLDAQKVVSNFVFVPKMGIFSILPQRFTSIGLILKGKRSSNPSKREYIPDHFSLNIFGWGFSYTQEVFSAPLDSRTFETEIRTSIPTLKALIKEVTLGSTISSKN